ncbi:MAG: U32 family peptidase [Patescibacteria group bacterium]
MKNSKPELMSPVKNRAGLEAAAPFADAVYFGVSELNLRANSKGVTLDSLSGFMKDCHEKQLKGYMTVNSTLYNDDIKKAEEVIKTAKKAKVDAVIVWDPAAIQIANDLGIDFFISTQANISNWQAAKFYQDVGAKRVILAREMTLDQIEEVRKKVDLEIESFIHGAMCLAESGRCILSGFYESSSANRGACNQLCRRRFKLIDDKGNVLETDGKHFLSPKDLCMIEHIPEMIEAGIDSFKIEGRQRSSKYVRETAKYYRKAIDSYFEGDFSIKKAKKWKENLKKVYNRGFSTGFYFGDPGPEGISFTSGNAGTMKRLQLGRVNHFYTKSSVVTIDLVHRGLKVGDKILIEGDTTYLEQEVRSMEIDGEKVERAKKGDEIGVKISSRARKNDRVYVLFE